MGIKRIVTGQALPAEIPEAGRNSRQVAEVRLLCSRSGEREKRGLCVAEGIRLAEEVLASKVSVEAGLVSPRLVRTARGLALLEALRAAAISIRKVSDRRLGSIADVEIHQGLLLVVKRPAWKIQDLLQGPRGPALLVASGIQDPGNLGALARVAEAAWCSGLLSCGATADPWAPRSLRASAGSLLRLPHMRLDDPLEGAELVRESGVSPVGASSGAEQSYLDAPLRGPFALFMGSEGAGLGPDLESRMDRLVRIPMRTGVESLNVAAAAAVLLFQSAGQASVSSPADPG